MHWTLLAVVAAALIWAGWTYHRFITLRQQLRDAWNETDARLRRRHELVPQLVESVRSCGRHELSLLIQVAALRGRAQTEPVGLRATHESELSDGIRRLLALAEDYPALKASPLYRQLQQALREVEAEIQRAGQGYNSSVNHWNAFRQSFPRQLIARLARFPNAHHFQLALASRGWAGVGSRP